MNKVVIVTGASRGIGRATAEKLLENGWCVALCCNENKSIAENFAMDYEKRSTHILIGCVFFLRKIILLVLIIEIIQK